MVRFADINEKIAENVVSGYKKMEHGIVKGAKAVMDKSMMALFSKEGETVEETRARLTPSK